MRIHDSCRLEVTTLICLSYKGETEKRRSKKRGGGAERTKQGVRETSLQI